MLTSNQTYFEIIEKPRVSNLKCLVLDYDGTLTTLRKGWDVILSDYARKNINPYNKECSTLESEILEFTDHAGGTTPKQLMSRLVALMKKMNLRPHEEIKSIAHYAKEYADHFQDMIDDRVKNFSNASESYVISHVRPMLEFISAQNTHNYVVTGSCELAVKDELAKLQMDKFFSRIYGASLEMEGNLKLDAISEIMDRHSLSPCEILIIGDGSTEMRAAKELNLPAIGIASDEHNGGLCEKKRRLLKDLGAHAIISDYACFQTVWDWLHAEEA